MMAQLPGPNPSYVTVCNLLASIFFPFSARSIFSFGILTALAAEMAASSLIFVAIGERGEESLPGSGPPAATAEEIPFANLAKRLLRLISLSALSCLMVAQ